jgi:hypothetical protein
MAAFQVSPYGRFWVSPKDLYRAIDFAGNTIDFLLSPYRDFAAARAFLQLAVAQGRPHSAARDQRGRLSGVFGGY